MFIINAIERKECGKGASRRLRAANKLPAIVYGGKEEAISIELDHNMMISIQTKPEFYSKVLILNIDGKKINVKVKAIQHHPFKLKLQHIDFIRI